MRVLQIANKALNPPDGGSLAILSLTKGYLQNNNKVHLFNIETHKHKNSPIPNELIENKNFSITGIELDIKIRFLPLLINFLFSRHPYIAQRFKSKKIKKELNTLINHISFDILQFEGLYSLQFIKYLPKTLSGKIIYRPHNLEHHIWDKTADESKSFLKSVYYRNMSKRLKRLEKKLLNKYDFIAPISENDLFSFNSLGNIKPGIVIPFGIDDIDIQNNANYDSSSLCYIGALDWIPNQNGLLWFIEKAFPLILDMMPETKFYIAGRNAPTWFIKRINSKNIIYCGQVESAQGFLLSHGPLIVPLFSGSGMRVKIIEAMAIRKAIVATNLAASGISYTKNEDILISNNEKDFAEKCINLLKNKTKQDEIGQKAFELIKGKYNNSEIVRSLLKFIKK